MDLDKTAQKYSFSTNPNLFMTPNKKYVPFSSTDGNERTICNNLFKKMNVFTTPHKMNFNFVSKIKNILTAPIKKSKRRDCTPAPKEEKEKVEEDFFTFSQTLNFSDNEKESHFSKINLNDVNNLNFSTNEKSFFSLLNNDSLTNTNEHKQELEATTSYLFNDIFVTNKKFNLSTIMSKNSENNQENINNNDNYNDFSESCENNVNSSHKKLIKHLESVNISENLSNDEEENIAKEQSSELLEKIRKDYIFNIFESNFAKNSIFDIITANYELFYKITNLINFCFLSGFNGRKESLFFKFIVK